MQMSVEFPAPARVANIQLERMRKEEYKIGRRSVRLIPRTEPEVLNEGRDRANKREPPWANTMYLKLRTSYNRRAERKTDNGSNLCLQM